MIWRIRTWVTESSWRTAVFLPSIIGLLVLVGTGCFGTGCPCASGNWVQFPQHNRGSQIGT